MVIKKIKKSEYEKILKKLIFAVILAELSK